MTMINEVAPLEKRQRTIYRCPVCEGPVILSPLKLHMVFVICESCNAVYDYFDPFYSKELYA